MKAVGNALILAVVVIGGGIMCNLISQMSEEQCAKGCPQNRAALSTKFDIGPFHLRMCNCGEVQK